MAETTIQGVIAGDGNLYVTPEEVERIYRVLFFRRKMSSFLETSIQDIQPSIG